MRLICGNFVFDEVFDEIFNEVRRKRRRERVDGGTWTGHQNEG
jgi:hypothetical protein